MTISDNTPTQRPLQLHITLHEARGFKISDADTVNPFVVCALGKRQHRSRVIKRSVAPKWNETFRMAAHAAEGKLLLEVRDYDMGAPDELIGRVAVELSELTGDQHESDHWYQLEQGRGEIRVGIKLTRKSPAKQTGEADAAGVHFQAVRPWAGSIFAPSNFDASTVSAEPAGQLKLEHAYGYRSRNCRNNIRLVAASHRLLYHTAALGVVHALAGQRQTFYQGHGSAEILALTVDPSGRYAATGDQVTNYNGPSNSGEKPSVLVKVWEVEQPEETLSTLQCTRGMAGVVSLAFSAPAANGESQYIAAVGADNDHTICLFDWRKGGEPLCSMSGHSDKVLEIIFHPTDPTVFVTVGVKHVKFWKYDATANTLDARKGVFGALGEIQPLLSGAFIDNERIVTGGHNGDVYIWNVAQRTIVETVRAAHTGPVFSVVARLNSGFLTGGKDGRLLWHCTDRSNASAVTLLKPDGQDDGSVAAIRAISWDGDLIAVGYSDSSIDVIADVDAALATGEPVLEARRLVEAHSTVGNAEVWGLAVHPTAAECVTASEDMRIIRWDVAERHPMVSVQLDARFRSCAYHPKGTQIAVAADTDDVVILDAQDLSLLHELHEEGGRQTAVEHPIKYSPDGRYLAVGGLRDDHGIAIYRTADWKLATLLRGHASHVIHFDWSSDSRYLQSNSMEHELLFWSLGEDGRGEQITKPSDLADTCWATFALTMAWPTVGIWEPGMLGRDINAVSRHPRQHLLVSGDDNSQVGLHTYPCHAEAMPSRKYRGHASHVTAVAFTANGEWALSVGGLDGTLLQWRVVSPN